MNKQVITKIQRLENKETNSWNEFKLGAEASNVYVRNGNGTAETAQSLLLKNLEPIEYTYGQDIWDANNEVIEQLTWSNIQKWLNEGRINDFLKEGDCIAVTTDINMSSVPNEEVLAKYHFYVIGINRHNGQSTEDLDLNHIDFCGGSMVQLGRRFVSNNGLIGNGQPGETEYNFAYLPSNNGKEEDNGIYGNYFVDGIFSVENPVKTPVQCLEEICNNEDIPISNKKLYLDARFRPNLAFLNAWASQGLNKTVDNLITDLASIWENMQADSDNWYSIFYSGFKGQDGILDTYPITSGVAQKVFRVSGKLEKDDFLIDANCDNTGFSLCLLRYSNGNEDLLTSSIIMGSTIQRGEDLAGYFLNLCETAFKWLTENGGSYSVVSKKSINHPFSSIWSLTEKEFFGECTFSNAEYAQGQIFQYPIFNDLSFRKKVTRDLSRSSGGVCNMVTLTPVENSNTEVAGMDPDTLMPVAASILKTNTYTPDMPICFRLQENTNGFNPTPDLNPIPEGYQIQNFFNTEGRYSCNTELRPTSGTLGFELKVAPHTFSDPAVGSAVYIGGFWSEPSSMRDDVSNWLTIVLGGQVRLRQWIHGSSAECVYSNQGAVQLDTPCVISGRFQRNPELSVNGTPYESLTLGESVLQRDTWLCSNGRYGDSEPDADVYYCKLWDGDTLSRDMVPVYEEATERYGMWDFITQNFYPFVYG